MDNIDETYKELSTLHKLFIKKPIFGVEVITEEKISEENLNVRTDDIEIIDSDQYFHNTAGKNAYIVGCDQNSTKEIVFCEELGLSIEKLPSNLTIEQLWKIV